MKVTFLSILSLFYAISYGQDISIDDFIGLWAYEYSQDSVEGRWISYAEKDLEIVLNEDNAIFQEVDGEQMSEPFLQSYNAPLFLKDALLTVKVFPINGNSDMVRFSFLQMPRGDDDFKYIDRSKGDLKGTVFAEGGQVNLTLINFDREEEYKILSISQTNMVLLDVANNTKHLFKRKQQL